MAISNYFPGTPPRQSSPALQEYLDRELTRIADILNRDNVTLPILGAEPARPQDGMIVYADGTAWNPGSGEGFYGYEAGAWVKL